MDRKSIPIGFEGVYSGKPRSFIGFEQYEGEQDGYAAPVYPLGMISIYLTRSKRTKEVFS
jgi:hypothetical protein